MQMIVFEDDAPRIRRPCQERKITGLRQPMPDRFLESQGIAHQQRLSAAFVAQVSYALAVLAPKGIGLADSRSGPEIAHGSILDRHAEHVTARRYEHALAAGRELRGGNMLCRILPLRARLQRLRIQADRESCRLTAGNIERFKLTANFVNDRVF